MKFDLATYLRIEANKCFQKAKKDGLTIDNGFSAEGYGYKDMEELFSGYIRPGDIQDGAFENELCKGTLIGIARKHPVRLTNKKTNGTILYRPKNVAYHFTDSDGVYSFIYKGDVIHATFYDAEAVKYLEEARSKSENPLLSFKDLGINPDVEKDISLEEGYSSVYQMLNAFSKDPELMKKHMKERQL